MKKLLIFSLVSIVVIGCEVLKPEQDMAVEEETPDVIQDHEVDVEPVTTSSDSDLIYHKTELSDLRNIAIEEQKIIMLFFSADWCKPCKEYKNVTFEEPKTKSYLQEHYLIKYLDVETDFEGIELNTSYSIKNLPTLVFLNPEGEEINRVVGHIAGYSFLKKIHEINAIH